MSSEARFVVDAEPRVCPRCGSLLGRYGDREGFCPAPICDGAGELVPGADASFLYRARALLFVPTGGASAAGCDEVGSIIAVKPEEVTSAIARGHAPVVATDVCWPKDRKRFGELFDHHIHHVNGPLVEPPNDGWDADRPLPVL